MFIIIDRWMDMIMDFGMDSSQKSMFNAAKIYPTDLPVWGEYTKMVQSIERKLGSMNEKEKNILSTTHIQSYVVSIHVKDSPVYSEERVEKFDPQDFKERIWYSGSSGELSGPTYIFTQNCKEYLSFHSNLPKCLASGESIHPFMNQGNVMTGNCDTHGGFELHYYIQMPMYHFLVDVAHVYRFEIYGRWDYNSSKSVNYEELIVLSEAMKHQKVNFTVDIKRLHK